MALSSSNCLLFIVSIILGCLSCFYIKVNSNMDYIFI
jgi:hypothetical protein